MSPNVKALLFDMQQAAIGIGLFVDGKTVVDLKSDLMLRLAVERQFEIIGEAMSRLRKLSPDTVARISGYRGIIRFRNVLSHGYDVVNSDTTWQIVQNKLPVPRAEVERLLNEP
jgi:uncharacterized protein with HEPN domain